MAEPREIREFNGKRYYLDTGHHSRGGALKRAKELRKTGYLVRTVQWLPLAYYQWYTYKRKRKQ